MPWLVRVVHGRLFAAGSLRPRDNAARIIEDKGHRLKSDALAMEVRYIDLGNDQVSPMENPEHLAQKR